MEARVSGHSLADALAVARKVVNVALPNLIKVSSFPGHVQVQATNLETYLTIWVPAETLEEGKACVYVEGLRRVVKKGKDLRLWTRDGHLVVQVGDVGSGLSLVSVEEFPNFPNPTYQSTLPTKLLLSAIERVEFAVAKHKNSMGYGYLFVGGKGSIVSFVAGDGFRFAVFKAEVPFEDRIELPYRSLEVLKTLLEKEEEETIKVGKEKSFVFLAGTNWEAALRVKFWSFPDYREIIPKKFKTRIVLDIEELDRALQGFSSVEEVVFHIDKKLKLTTKRVKNRKVEKIETEITAKVEGQTLSAAFSPKLLKEFTKSNKGTVEILLTDNNRPAVFKLGEDFLYLLIPKRI